MAHEQEQVVNSRELRGEPGRMIYKDAVDYLHSIEMMGIKPGLETTRTVLAHLSLKTELSAMRFIQVAGTNGKGSTSFFLASILHKAGYRVGLFTSPHIHEVRERVAVNGRDIKEEDFAAGVSAVKETAQQLYAMGKLENMPTYFETTFLTAIYCFSQHRTEIVILEVGLGGRWDATTAITPAITVITTIDRDHTTLLGTRLRDIAAEKAGIIKPGVPVVCGCGTRTEAYRVIKAAASRNNAPFFPVIDSRNRLEVQSSRPPYRCIYTVSDTIAPESSTYSFEVSLNGSHQTLNAAAAVKTLRVLSGSEIRIDHSDIRSGLAVYSIPGRIEILDTFPRVILDGGHNVQSIIALTRFLAEQHTRGLTLVFGVMADKNYRQMIRLLLPYIGSTVLTQPQSDRALPAGKLAGLFKRNGKKSHVLIKPLPEEAYSAARQFNRDILITGSFYLVGAIRQIIINTTRRVRWTRI
jgi:dihydrofolate synthase/folylpolyglutamate synthase